MERAVARFLAGVRARVVSPILAAYRGPEKASPSQAEIARLLRLMDETPFEDLPAEVQPYLEGVYRAGMEAGFAQVGVNTADIEDLLDMASEAAVEYARTRGAEMVGMKWVDGELVPNPNAEWAISDGTREALRSDIRTAMEEGWSNDRLAQAFEENAAFGPARAEMVARTETAYADARANMDAWTESGVVRGKVWLLSNLEGICDICEGNADAGEVDLGDAFPSGDKEEPAHPNCRCITAPVVDDAA